MKKFDVFISYSKKDKHFAYKLRDDLQRFGIECWIDEYEVQIGDPIVTKISEELRKSRFFIIILSRSSLKSGWVQKELALALSEEIRSNQKKVLPLLIDECEIPSSIIDKAYLDFSNQSNYHSVLSKLVKIILEEKTKRKITKVEKIKVISFDLDGAICDNAIDEYLWRSIIPRLYAAQEDVSYSEAFMKVSKLYADLWSEVGGKWRDPDFWLHELKINTELENILPELSSMLFAYPDVRPVLEELSKKYNLVLTTTAPRKLMEYKINNTGLHDLFIKTFSVSTDFNQIAKYAEVYVRICSEMEVEISEMAHCGDDELFDVLIPKQLGILTFLLDRRGLRRTTESIADLFELRERLLFQSKY